jgi:pyruvate/2-oxoglutarate dehydrogenase complex dihydrolipoamide dehydrogenase (E3) component
MELMMNIHNEASTLRADVLVIGFGKGGKTVAATMGRLGKRVVLVEQSDRMYGGTCPNVGCVPTKALVHHSHKRRPADAPQWWYEQSVREVQAIREMMRLGNFDALNNADTVTVVTGRATFLDPYTVGVGAGSDRLTITAETILINTGSEPIIPDIPGLRESRHTLTSTDLIQTTNLPDRLAIIGGGYLGIEFGSIYRRFGSQVTMFELSPRILRGSKTPSRWLTWTVAALGHAVGHHRYACRYACSTLRSAASPAGSLSSPGPARPKM